MKALRVPSFLGRDTIILFAISFIINLGFSFTTPIFPFYILALKGVIQEVPELEVYIRAEAAAIEFGVLMASFMLTRAVMAAFSGYLSDILGRRKMILLGSLIYFLTAIAYIFCPNITFLILIRASQGVASAMVWPVAEAMLSDLVKRVERGRTMSIYVSLMNFANIFGPYLGVAAYKAYIASTSTPDLFTALRIPFILLVAASFSSLIASFCLHDVREAYGSRVRGSWSRVREAISELSGKVRRSLNTIYLNGVVNGFGMGIVETAFVIFVINEVSKDPSTLGLLYSVGGIVSILSSIFAGHLSDKIRERKKSIFLSYLISRPLLFLTPFVKDVASLIILFSLFNLAFGVSMPLMRALQADLVPSKIRGTIFGLQQTFFNSGVVAGALIGGYLCEALATKSISIFGFVIKGIAAPFLITAALGVFTTILFALFVSETKWKTH